MTMGLVGRKCGMTRVFTDEGISIPVTEFRLADAEGGEFEKGGELKVDLFEEGQKVDVIGTSIGKGFAGTVKRHNFSMQDATHGNSLAHRAPGSIGQNQTPGRVFKGKTVDGEVMLGPEGHEIREEIREQVLEVAGSPEIAWWYLQPEELRRWLELVY